MISDATHPAPDAQERLPLHYDDLPGLVGKDLGWSPWISVDQPMIDSFAAITQDHQWIHVDRERAEREIGGTLAHGLLLLGLLPAMTRPLVEMTGVEHILNYGLDRVRFMAPVPSGRRIRGWRELLSLDERAGGRLVRSRVTAHLEGGQKPVYSVETLILARPANGYS